MDVVLSRGLLHAMQGVIPHELSCTPQNALILLLFFIAVDVEFSAARAGQGL